MSYFIVVKQPLENGLFASEAANPGIKEIMQALHLAGSTTVFCNEADASQHADTLFHPRRPPKASGHYGLIVEIDSIIVKSDDPKPTDTQFTVNADQIEAQAVIATSMSAQAKAQNSRLEARDFKAEQKCTII